MTENHKTAFRIRNWSIHQHYSDRNPPWIKLHFALLTSEDWVMWDNDARALAIVCMLLASRNQPPGELTATKEYIQRVGFLKKIPDFLPLVETGFLIPVEMPVSDQRRVETEERQRRGEVLATASNPLASASVAGKALVTLPFQSDDFKKAWQSWCEHRRRIRKPMTRRAEELVLKRLPADEAGATLWINNAIEKGWQAIYEPKERRSDRITPQRQKITRDQAIQDSVRSLVEAHAADPQNGVRRTLLAINDKYRDMPCGKGASVATEAMDIWEFQQSRGRLGPG